MNHICEYDLGNGVDAWTVMRETELPCDVVLANQVHGYRVAVVTSKTTLSELDGVDALVTGERGICIGVKTADCLPVLLYDPVQSCVGAVHSGWRGTLVRIVQKTVFQMQTSFGTIPSDIRAVIGPGICGGCFQVDEDIVTAFKESGFCLTDVYSWGGAKCLGNLATGHHIDLVAANRLSLIECGVKAESITLSGLCTYEDARLYSARREGVTCGRNITAIRILH